VSSAFDLIQILRVLIYPAAVLVGFQLGKYFQISSSGHESSVGGRPPVSYKFFTPTIKVGSYFDTESTQLLGLSRISVISIDSTQAVSQDVPAVLIETAGTVLNFSPGRYTKKVSSNRFFIPANVRMKSEDHAIFQFVYDKDSLSLTSISVDHINLPAQEVTFAICVMQYR
jgi:hypothetical protein